LEFLLLF